jgi:carbonic anhydrase
MKCRSNQFATGRNNELKRKFESMSRSRKPLDRLTVPTVMAAIVILLAFAVGCRKTETGSTTSVQRTSQDETKPDWDYSTERGPEQWGELSPDYVLAAIGRSQSPIDIVTRDVITADLPFLEFDTHPANLKVLNNGHSVEFIAPGGSTLKFRGQTYKLTQYHFHAPSEHTIDGKHADVEVHFVHSDSAGQLAVVAVLYEEGDEDHPSFLILDDQAPTQPGEEKVFPEIKLNVSRYFPSSAKEHKYFMYDGSLTTPPASEGVRWFVCTETVSVSRRQIDIVKKLYFHNNRPVQPAHSRLVLTPR